MALWKFIDFCSLFRYHNRMLKECGGDAMQYFIRLKNGQRNLPRQIQKDGLPGEKPARSRISLHPPHPGCRSH